MPRRRASPPVEPQETAAMPARVTFIPEPSAKVPMQNTQVRLPEHIADKLRMLAAMTRQKQQAMMERWITRGVEEEWRRVTQAD